jgi:hypothetical protein
LRVWVAGVLAPHACRVDRGYISHRLNPRFVYLHLCLLVKLILLYLFLLPVLHFLSAQRHNGLRHLRLLQLVLLRKLLLDHHLLLLKVLRYLCAPKHQVFDSARHSLKLPLHL